MIIADLHNHTPLCNHATGSIEQYIEKAISLGIKHFGFADHAPMDFDTKYRMGFEQMREYENSVLRAKEKYKDKIDILLGYEVDYLKGHMDDRVLNADVDYLIGSVHFIDKWGFDNPEFIGNYEGKNIDEIWQSYFDTVQEMAQSKLFDIVGHLDLIKVFKFMPQKDIQEIAKDALLCIKEADMVLEINMAGFRKPINEAYPSTILLKEAYKLDIPITFSSDAHEPNQIGLFSKEILKMAKEVGYKKCVIFSNKQKKFIDF